MTKPETQTFSFEAEVSRLLEIVTHALYSDRDVFLRELISNASDAADRLRHVIVSDPARVPEAVRGTLFAITLKLDSAARTLTISDNGIGLTREDLIAHLGTIAKSGTAAFLKALEASNKDQPSLIGQFGVGFYSAFMVADRVDVITRSAFSTREDEESWLWSSDGRGTYTLEAHSKKEHGTDVVLHLKEDAGEYLQAAKLKAIVQKYSDHISVPIYLAEGAAEKSQINTGSALWMRPAKDVTEEQYTEFYRSSAHAFDTPWLRVSTHAEGLLSYRALLFIPSTRPFDLFDPARKHSVKLYVRRVFITDDLAGLMPTYLRFMKGVVDAEDLPLNVSREMLQLSPLVAKIRAGLTKKILSSLEDKAKNDPDAYAQFWSTFGAVLKEGLCEDSGHQETLLALLRVRSTSHEGTSLAEYITRMKPGQDKIYYLAGTDAAALQNSPQLEGFVARGIEVLVFTDPVDEFWLPAISTFHGKDFQSITRGDVDLSGIAGDMPPPQVSPADVGSQEKLVAYLKGIYGDAVEDVKISSRLNKSPICLVAPSGELDFYMEHLLAQMHAQGGGTSDAMEGLLKRSRKIVEVNPTHPLIQKLAAKIENPDAPMADLAWLLFDQAWIQEGQPPRDVAAFTARLDSVLGRALEG